MNRRTYIKNSLIFGTLGLASFSAFKWFEFSKQIDPKTLWDKKELIGELAEVIIPETDTPGAKAASVNVYIINVLLNCTDAKQQNKFLTGLDDLENYSIDKYGKTFLKCNLTEKDAIVEHFADHSGYSNRLINKINNKLLGEPFYSKLRNLTIEGYCLSQLGATQGLAYDYIPGKFESCIPLQKNQKSWATK